MEIDFRNYQSWYPSDLSVTYEIHSSPLISLPADSRFLKKYMFHWFVWYAHTLVWYAHTHITLAPSPIKQTCSLWVNRRQWIRTQNISTTRQKACEYPLGNTLSDSPTKASHWWIPLTNASDAEFWCFLCLNGRVNRRDAGDLRRHCTHYEVTVILSYMQSGFVFFIWISRPQSSTQIIL